VSAPNTNDRRGGLERLRAANRWMVAGALGLTGVFSWIAARAFPGKAATPHTAASQTPAASDNSSSASSDQGNDQQLTPPLQAPTVPQNNYQQPVVSGGS
jgi:cytoskeletal protein RodZ